MRPPDLENVECEIQGETLYLLTGHNNMLRGFNKRTGAGTLCFKFSGIDNVQSFHVNGKGTIFVGVNDVQDQQKSRVILFDLRTFEEKMSPSFDQKGSPIFLKAGSYFIRGDRGVSSISIVDPKGKITHVPQTTQEYLESHPLCLFTSCLASFENTLFYQEWGTDKQGRDNTRLVKYNMTTDTRGDAIKLPFPMTSSPQITPHGDTLVYLGHKQLGAIGTSPLKILWKIPIFNSDGLINTIDTFHISPDGKRIYGVSEIATKALWMYDISTGKEEYYGGAIKPHAQAHKFIDLLPTRDGKVQALLVPYSY